MTVNAEAPPWSPCFENESRSVSALMQGGWIVRSKHSQRIRRTFTLLELLVVVAVLSTLAGGLLVAYDGVEAQAAKGQATNP